jgi:hypothetical protein
LQADLDAIAPRDRTKSFADKGHFNLNPAVGDVVGKGFSRH